MADKSGIARTNRAECAMPRAAHPPGNRVEPLPPRRMRRGGPEPDAASSAVPRGVTRRDDAALAAVTQL